MDPVRLPTAYDFREFEERRYREWEEAGAFTPTPGGPRPAYSIVIPPPNVTGSLHMGHALNNTLQDILIRYHRLAGWNALWVPGTDHAGIATQTVVERTLAAEGTDRHTLGREAFIERVWQWREQYGNRIINQLRRLGSACDWSRTRFTMDEGLSKAVREVFVRLYEDGLIYRGDYIINWCPRCHTALSDLEVEHREQASSLWFVRYPGKDGGPGVVVATTRPETIPGDTAVAVHAEDPRYEGIRGSQVVVPIIGRVVPVVADPTVQPEFGTGALKITPAHDPADFEIGKRHGLESIRVINESGKMTAEAGRYAGLDRTACREAIVADMQEAGLLERVEDYRHSIGHCYRCQTVVEPLLSKQWFVRAKVLAGPAISAVREGKIRIIPDNWEKTYFEWMENIRDWCISRQIWWGHRIPAWYCGCGEVVVSRETPAACPKCGGMSLRQDDDVLDTWFSSALWPFSTLGWPEETEELKYFYPTSALVTGFDILFFWVARMIMMGLRFRGEVPFRDVYIHALVRDESGQKMSKTKGNVIDPLEIIDEYGADAFRFTLTALAAQGRDIRLSPDRIAGYGRFVNKIWNAARFSLMNLEGFTPPETVTPAAWYQRWILSRLAATVEETTGYLDGYRFDMAAKTLYNFFWHTFCDWYIELAKPDLLGRNGEEAKAAAQAVLHRVLSDSLVMLHPIIPFITEELWQHLPGTEGSIMDATWPKAEAGWVDAAEESRTGDLMALITSVRTLRAELDVPPSAQVSVTVRTHAPSWDALIGERGAVLTQLANVRELIHGPAVVDPPQSVTEVVQGAEIFLPVGGLVDLPRETARLEKELGKIGKELEKLEGKLDNEAFRANAPEEVVEKVRSEREEAVARREHLRSHLRRLSR
jgi:valyl-tRNA synthetase